LSQTHTNGGSTARAAALALFASSDPFEKSIDRIAQIIKNGPGDPSSRPMLIAYLNGISEATIVEKHLAAVETVAVAAHRFNITPHEPRNLVDIRLVAILQRVGAQFVVKADADGGKVVSDLSTIDGILGKRDEMHQWSPDYDQYWQQAFLGALTAIPAVTYVSDPSALKTKLLETAPAFGLDDHPALETAIHHLDSLDKTDGSTITAPPAAVIAGADADNKAGASTET